MLVSEFSFHLASIDYCIPKLVLNRQGLAIPFPVRLGAQLGNYLEGSRAQLAA